MGSFSISPGGSSGQSNESPESSNAVDDVLRDLEASNRNAVGPTLAPSDPRGDDPPRNPFAGNSPIVSQQ